MTIRIDDFARAATLALVCGLICALAGCSSPPAPEKPASAKVEQPKARNLVAEVRAAGADGDDALEVQALRDPVIEDIRASATRAESAGKFSEADGFILEALGIIPNDPELLQWRAEIALAQGKYEAAAALANNSWEKGPKLGALCRRNWTAIKLAREMGGYAAAATSATEQAAKCTVAPPTRM